MLNIFIFFLHIFLFEKKNLDEFKTRVDQLLSNNLQTEKIDLTPQKKTKKIYVDEMNRESKKNDNKDDSSKQSDDPLLLLDFSQFSSSEVMVERETSIKLGRLVCFWMVFFCVGLKKLNFFIAFPFKIVVAVPDLLTEFQLWFAPVSDRLTHSTQVSGVSTHRSLMCNYIFVLFLFLFACRC